MNYSKDAYDVLNEIFDKHKKWLDGDENGEQAVFKNIRMYDAVIKDKDLRKADFSGAKLYRANFVDCNLTGAIFDNSNIGCSIFFDCTMEAASFKNSELYDVDFRNVSLRNTNFEESDLYDLDFDATDFNGSIFCSSILNCFSFVKDVNLTNTDFSNCTFNSITFHECPLSGSKFNNIKFNKSYFCDTDMTDVEGLPEMVCPEEGSFIGYKKVLDRPAKKSFIITLEIPEDAERLSSFDNDCRCSKAKVLSIESLDDDKDIVQSITNMHYVKTAYTVGEMVYPDSYNSDRWKKYSNGIHFFMSKEEAVNFSF